MKAFTCMKVLLLALPLLGSLTAAAQGLPATPQRPVTDTYFGQKVTDNYRWLEDTNSPEVQAWFKAQGDHTAQVMATIPGRDSLVNTLVRYDALKASQIGGITRRGGRFFYKKPLPTENVGKLYYRTGSTGPEVLLFDPGTYGKGKKYAISYFVPSEDGRRLALGLAETLNDGLNTTAKQLNLRTNRWEELPLPGVGSNYVQLLEPTSNDCLLYLTSWKQPETMYAYNPATKQSRVSPFEVPA